MKKLKSIVWYIILCFVAPKAVADAINNSDTIETFSLQIKNI